MALMAVICSPEKVDPRDAVQVRCQAEESDLLFIDWINALIYEIDIRKMLFSRFEVHLDGTRLTAVVWGEPADPDKHELAVEVKAATYMALKVFLNPQQQWVAQCVVDV